MSSHGVLPYGCIIGLIVYPGYLLCLFLYVCHNYIFSNKPHTYKDCLLMSALYIYKQKNNYIYIIIHSVEHALCSH